jgi:hypothetical protein
VSKLQANPEPELNRHEAFQATASDLDAAFVAGKLSSGYQVHLQHGPWRVILATCVVNHGQNPLTYTRARAFFVAREDFTLRVSRRNVFTRMAEIFGFYGLRIGDQKFERKYTIKISNQPRGRSLMMDWRLRELIRGGWSTTSVSWSQRWTGSLRSAGPMMSLWPRAAPTLSPDAFSATTRERGGRPGSSGTRRRFYLKVRSVSRGVRCLGDLAHHGGHPSQKFSRGAEEA